MKYDGYDNDKNNFFVKETAINLLQKHQGQYTVDDYYNLPDDIRAELIDGVLYDMTAPYTDHQVVAGYIYYNLYNHIKNNNGKCRVFASHIDVQLNQDNSTMVQPDLFVICNKDIIEQKCIFGAPDFILEVLSRSTKIKDTVIKLNKYRDACVKEYWMIDIENKAVHIYEFINNTYVVKSFDESHEITVLEKPCTIDFKDMYQELLFYYK